MEETRTAEVSEYKGKPIISLPLGESGKFWFSFGVGKARAIIEHLDEIRAFVDSVGKEV